MPFQINGTPEESFFLRSGPPSSGALGGGTGGGGSDRGSSAAPGDGTAAGSLQEAARELRNPSILRETARVYPACLKASAR
eukprot:scaffold1765_cov385-Prasinococcus_capsulatus_cf.AAC.2